MDAVFLYDPSSGTVDKNELDGVMRAGFPVYTSLTSLPHGVPVVARHYAWPWPSRLDRELRTLGCRSINDRRAYEWADRPVEWCAILGELTPRTWTRAEDVPELPGGYILKGAKSMKWDWSRMFAPTKSRAIEIFMELNRDTGMADHEIVFREFIPLHIVGDGGFGCPIAEEYRVFFYKNQELSRGLYPVRDDVTGALCGADAAFERLLYDASQRIAEDGSIDYYTLDVARTAAGGWIVIEISDGLRAGLSENEPATLYENLARCLAVR